MTVLVDKNILNGSPSHLIPDKVINGEIKELVQNLEATPNFDPHTVFDPEKHILFKDEDYGKFKILTLSELGINKTHVPTISDTGVTNPFPLFTEEACNIMKWEAFQVESLKKYGRLPKLAKNSTNLDFQICGYIKQAPFTYAAWTHPRTQEIIDKIAGVKLKIMFDYEIAHINASLINKDYPVGEKLGKEGNLEDSVYDWHYDSNSFVIVLMLSTNDEMIGGKTGLKDGDEKIVTVDDPKIGYATILQGRVIKHIATKPITNHERISSVVGYIPDDIEVPDTTVLTSFKPSVLPRSIHDEYYPEWCEYRFKRIEDMLANKRKQLFKAEGHFDQEGFIEFCKGVEDYLQKTWNEFEVCGEKEHPPKIYSVPYKDL